MSDRKRRRRAPRTQAGRIRFLSLLVTLAGAGLVARAGQIQLGQTERWRALAGSQTRQTDRLPAARGGIFDRNGRPLAVSREEYDAYFAPAESRDRDADVEAIVSVAGLDRGARARLAKARKGWSAIGRVDGRIRAGLEEAVGAPVHFEPVVTRVYPEGPLARNLLGSVDGRGRGQSGLELVFDSLLAGTEGEIVRSRDAAGALYPLRGAEHTPPRPGNDIVLEIDIALQEIAEQALRRALEETGATGGDVVMADPRTGAILAVASRRGESGFGVPAFADPYEPGSTVKPFLLASLLQEGRASLTERIATEDGKWRTPYRTIRDVHGYDSLTVAEVIQHSSNIGAAKLAVRLEPGLQYSYLRDFGFGTATGAEVPSESAGRLRRPAEWSALSQESLAFGYELLVTSVQLVAAYGALANGGLLLQPVLVREVRDPDGRTVSRSAPRALRRVITPAVARQVTDVLGSVVSEQGTGRQALVETLSMAGKTGTARIASGGDYAQRRYAASFVGYAPADDPTLVILTKLEDPKGSYYGGGTAAPVSRSIVQAILAGEDSDLVPVRAQVPLAVAAASPGRALDWADDAVAPGGDVASGPAEPAVPSPAAPRPATTFRFAAASEALESADPVDVTDALPAQVSVPDVRGVSVREAVGRLHRAGFRVEVLASGRVEEQQPAPGVRAVRGARVLLR